MEKQIKTGIIFDIDHFAVHDGAGIRTCIYVKGCPLHCAWCHSPESQSREPEVLFAENRCVDCGTCAQECDGGLQRLEDGVRSFNRATCVVCGECVKVCSTGALILAGKTYAVHELLDEILPDKIFFENSGGGVTISGGEVLMQADFVLQVLKALKEHKIHTIVETSGYGSTKELLMLAEFTDIFYYDYKLGNPELFKRYVGGDVAIVLDNLKKLRIVTDKIVLRVPIIPGITDTQQNIDCLYELAVELDIGQIHFLPYNTSAGAKYEWCGKQYELGLLTTDMYQLERYQAMAPKHTRVDIMN